MELLATEAVGVGEVLVMREIGDDDFELAAASGTVLVDFYATWCPPCKALAPVLEKVSKDTTGVTFLKVNVDDHMLHASRLGVGSLPTLVLFQDGEEIKRHLGTLSEPALRAWVKV